MIPSGTARARWRRASGKARAAHWNRRGGCRALQGGGCRTEGGRKGGKRGRPHKPVLQEINSRAVSSPRTGGAMERSLEGIATRLDGWLKGETWWDIAAREARQNANPSPSCTSARRAKRQQGQEGDGSNVGSPSPSKPWATPSRPRACPSAGTLRTTPTRLTPGPVPGVSPSCDARALKPKLSNSSPEVPKEKAPTDTHHLRALLVRMGAHWPSLKAMLAQQTSWRAEGVREALDSVGVGATKHQVSVCLCLWLCMCM